MSNDTTYSLVLALHPPQTEYQVESRKLSPQTAKVSPIILTLIEGISSNYANFLQDKFERCLVKFSFSSKNGVVFLSASDERIKTVFHEQYKNEPLTIIPREDVESSGLKDMKTALASEYIKEEAFKHFQTNDVVYFDSFAYAIYQAGIEDDLELTVDITRRIIVGAGGLTTGSLRFPHLLGSLYEEFKDTRKSDKKKICIVGPGMNEDPEFPSSPQLSELCSLFPNAEFLVLDNDKTAIRTLTEQVRKGFLVYDSLMLRMRTIKVEGLGIESFQNYPKKYIEVFDAIKSGFADKAKLPPDAKSMLNGIGPIQPLIFGVDPKKIRISEFDITSSQFKDEDNNKFDIVVATMSIWLAIKHVKNPQHNHFSTFAKFLSILKQGGKLYIDQASTRFLDELYGMEGKKLGIRYIESLLGNRLVFNEIPLTDFISESQGEYDVVPNLTICKTKQYVPEDVQTSSITVITRTSDKVECSKEEKTGIQLDLIKLLKSIKK